MADLAQEAVDLKPDGFQSAESSPATQAAAASASRQLQAPCLSDQSTLIQATESTQLDTDPPVQLIPATPSAPASTKPILAQGRTFPSPNRHHSTSSLSDFVDCHHRNANKRDDHKHQTPVSPDLTIGLVQTEPTERQVMSSSTGDDEIPRARRLWESGRRSLAKIIASVSSSNQLQAARMSSNSELGPDAMSLAACGSSSCTYRTKEVCDAVIHSSAETSRVSSCDLEMTAASLDQSRHHQTQVSRSSYSRLVQQFSIPDRKSLAQSSISTPALSRPFRKRSRSPGPSGYAPSGQKFKVGKTRAASCQHELEQRAYAQSGALQMLEQFNGSTRCILNVGGTRHEVLWSTLLKVPRTRLWRLAYTACFLLQPSMAHGGEPHRVQPVSLSGTGACLTGSSSQPGAASATTNRKRRFTLSTRTVSMSTGSVFHQQNLNRSRPIQAPGESVMSPEVANHSETKMTTKPAADSVQRSILQYCDDFNLATNEFFFDRQPRSFSCVIDYYRTGKLHLSEDLCVMAFKDDLDYWEIDEFNLDLCCQQRYHQRRDNVFEEMKKEQESLKEQEEELFGTSKIQRYQKFVWDLLEKPQTSVAARVSSLFTRPA